MAGDKYMVAKPTIHQPINRHNGFSLVEAVISMAIVGIMLVAAINTLGGTAKARIINNSLQKGPALASDLMAEILQTAYEEPDDTPTDGKESGETDGTRTNFDDVDDFDGWMPGTVQHKDGTTITNTTGWTREVSVIKVQATDLDTASETGTLKKITVIVTSPEGKTCQLTGLRSQYSVYDQPPASDTIIISKAGVELQVGNDTDSSITSGAQILNRAATITP